MDTIAKWVRDGNRLLILGYELGERHHHTNVNRLAEEFGLRFNSDIVAPRGHDPAGKPYGKEVDFRIADSKDHPVLEGVDRLCMKNVCTLTVEPGSSTLVRIGGNGVSRESSPNYTDGWTSSGSPRFELLKFPEWFPVMAEAPIGLTGKGRVIAIGTWDFFGSDNYYKSHDNYLFAHNLMKWLSASG